MAGNNELKGIFFQIIMVEKRKRWAIEIEKSYAGAGDGNPLKCVFGHPTFSVFERGLAEV